MSSAGLRWLEAALSGDEPVAVLDSVLASATRLMTNHRVLRNRFGPEEALVVCEAVRSAPAAITPTLESTVVDVRAAGR